MIIGSTTDPVLVKKIQIRIWTLRDEIEGLIEQKVIDNKSNVISIDDIKKVYANYSETGQSDEVPKNSQLDDSEDEMAKALAESEAEDAVTEEIGEIPSETVDEIDNAQEQPSSPSSDDLAFDSTDPNKIMQRIPALAQEKFSNGMAILAEINMDAMYFFSAHNFIPGQLILIEFLVPKHFIVTAKIEFSRQVNMKSRIISQNKMPYRIGASFPFTKRGDRTLLRQFVQSIEPDVPAPTQKDTADKEGGDSDFSDFDDL